jgi:cyclic nucleotide gated channel
MSNESRPMKDAPTLRGESGPYHPTQIGTTLLFQNHTMFIPWVSWPSYFHSCSIWNHISTERASPATAMQVAGCIWYLLTVQRVESCIYEQCEFMANCSYGNMGCPISVSYGSQPPVAWAQRPSIIHSTCSISTAVRSNANYSFGIYSLGVPLVTDTNPVNKITLPLFWGIMTMR